MKFLGRVRELELLRVLITASEPTGELVREGYFTRILDLDALFG